MAAYAESVMEAAGSVISIISVLVTMGSLFVTSQSPGKGYLFSLFRSPVSILCLLVLMGMDIYTEGKCEAKKGAIHYQADMANVDSSRIYWYFFNLIFQYSAGKDIRIFHMRNIIRNKGKAALEEIDNVKREALRSTLKVEFWSMALRHGFMLYAYLFAGLKAILGAYLFAGLKAIRGIISIGGLTKYVGMLLLLQGQVSRLFSLLIRLRAHNTYLGSFSEYLETRPDGEP